MCFPVIEIESTGHARPRDEREVRDGDEGTCVSLYPCFCGLCRDVDDACVCIRLAAVVHETGHASCACSVDDVVLVQAEQVAASDALVLVHRLPFIRHGLSDLLADIPAGKI